MVREQIYLSRFEARVFSDYHEERWHRAGEPKDALDLQEAQRWQHKGEDLAFEAAKNTQTLFEDLATMQTLFPETPKLREQCEPLYKFKTIELKTEVPHVGPIENVSQWKNGAQLEAQALVESEYGKPLDELLAYLRSQLPH